MSRRRSRNAGLIALLLVAGVGCETNQYDPMQAQTLDPNLAPREPKSAKGPSREIGGAGTGQFVPGVRRFDPETGTFVTYVTLDSKGIDYELPTEEAAEVFVPKVTTATAVKWTSNGRELEVVNGRITYDGKDYGTVKRGDRIKVSPIAKLTVNGGERKPVDEAQASPK